MVEKIKSKMVKSTEQDCNINTENSGDKLDKFQDMILNSENANGVLEINDNNSFGFFTRKELFD